MAHSIEPSCIVYPPRDAKAAQRRAALRLLHGSGESQLF